MQDDEASYLIERRAYLDKSLKSKLSEVRKIRTELEEIDARLGLKKSYKDDGIWV